MQDNLHDLKARMRMNLYAESISGVIVGKRSAEVHGDTHPPAVDKAGEEVPH